MADKTGKSDDLPTQLEEALYNALVTEKQTGRSMNNISELSGVPVSTISRMLSGNRAGLSLHTAGRLCAYLGLILGRPAKRK